MNIGFDAKRAYHNRTGLGYYSRTIINLLVKYFPEHSYFLFNPKRSSSFNFDHPHLKEVLPTAALHRLFPSAWRSSWVKRDLRNYRIDLYHGLSHEIPIGIDRTGIRSVVTIHDLIHERYPEQYNPIDVRIYHKKFLYASTHASRVVAISEQTKRDLVEFYKVPAEKIEVCMQSCDPAFGEQVPEEEKERIKKKYQLPAEYFLYVGSIIERKNLLNICKALFLIRAESNIPLVVIGQGGKYKQQVMDFLLQNGLTDRVVFLLDKETIRNDPEFRTAKAFAAIYQSALAMVYPSFFEGFGAPVLEALWSKLPVITSNLSCLPEVAGDAALYVDPQDAQQIASAMKKVVADPELVRQMKEKGWKHALKSSPEIYARHMMDIYLRTMEEKS